MRRCHRRTVQGVTRRCIRRLRGRSRISAAKIARPAQSSRGRGLVRRSTANSCRSTSSSMSLDAVDRPTRTSQPQSRMKIRYSKRIDTADHHARGPDQLPDAQVTVTGRLLTPHTVRKSHAIVPAAWERKNATQLWPPLLGAGPSRCARRIVRTDVADTATPSLRHSPDDPQVSPAAVLSGQPHDELDDVFGQGTAV